MNFLPQEVACALIFSRWCARIGATTIVDLGNYMIKNALYWRAKSCRCLPSKLN
jgi:hypothetical protein